MSGSRRKNVSCRNGSMNVNSMNAMNVNLNCDDSAAYSIPHFCNGLLSLLYSLYVLPAREHSVH